jgi:hypothetical protein
MFCELQHDFYSHQVSPRSTLRGQLFQILIQPPEEEDRDGRPDDAQDFF